MKVIRVETSTVMKFVDRLDAFVKFRVYTPDELQQVLRDARISDRDSYMAMVVDKCVAWLPEKARPGVTSPGASGEAVREILYDACVGLNPGLDIRRVLVPVPERAHPSPAEAVSSAKRISMRRLAEGLRRKVVGQEVAVQAVAAAVARAYVGLRDPDRPAGVFLFVGPTGVGKTEMARALADELGHGERDALVRIDCSEYSQPHEYAKLIGAPPGYVGYEQGGYLPNVMAEANTEVVLFDEIEKADERVHNLLLQVMDEGRITDAKGQKIDFTDTVIVLTSNLGATECEALEHRLGFGLLKRGAPSHAERVQATQQALGQRFKPEFLNRVDETVVFRNLSRDDAALIVDKFAGQLAQRAQAHGLELVLTPEARSWIVGKGFSEAYGARELRRCLQRYVETPLAEALLEGRLPRHGKAFVEVAADALSLRGVALPKTHPKPVPHPVPHAPVHTAARRHLAGPSLKLTV